MAKRPKKPQKSPTKPQELVAVAFAEDMEQAKNYEVLLKNNDIPAMISRQYQQPTGNKSIAVMVPEEFLDEAHVVIESQDAYDDFYDFALEGEDEDEDDYAGDFFGDNFQ